MPSAHRFAIALALVVPAAPVYAQQDFLPATIRTSAACAPVAGSRPSDAYRIIGTTDAAPKTMYSLGEQVVIDAGTERGVQIGQRYYVRRPMTFHNAPRAEDTLGWVQIVATTDRTAIANVEFSCDGLASGDHLEPYAEPVLPPGVDRTDATGEIDFSRTAQILYGNEGRHSAGGREFMIVDIGQSEGVAPGSRFAIYRDVKVKDVPLVAFGEAIVVSAAEETSLIRVTMARDAVIAGDLVVARRGGAASAGAGAGAGAAGAGGQQAGGAGEGNVPGAGGTVQETRVPLASFAFEDVYFDFDRFTLRTEALTLLDQAVKALQANAATRVQIEGHTCNIGTAEYNLALGERRSNAVRDYLISRGIAATRLTTVSYGEERPKYDNAREETRRLNRRAALTVNVTR
jgi:peptidoglycan-associated lipoprotein